jgi:hypothetical protein
MITSKTSVAVLLAVILGWSFKAAAQTPQYVTLIDNTNAVYYQVQTNQVISVVGYDRIDKPQLLGYPTAGAPIPLTVFSTAYASNSTALDASIPQVVTGLTSIAVTTAGWATFQITTPGCTTLVNGYVPADAVVIPSSATGNVQIILESSPDLVNWTAANPGIYGASSATNRFFRVRAVMQ